MLINKYKVTLIIIISLMIISLFKLNAFFEYPLSGKTIYLDPGHGGIDPGANYKDIFEKDINLELCMKLKLVLESKGATVFLTRDKDDDLADNGVKLRKRSDLYKRVQLINQSKADLYISIHLNSDVNTTFKGAQVFYDDINKSNEKIALIMQKYLKDALATKREIKEVNDLYMYRIINKPGVLIEVGFISNPNERYILQKSYYQDKIAASITKGVIEYFK